MKQEEVVSYKSVIYNIGTLLTGDINSPVFDADTIICCDGIISHIGFSQELDLSEADLMVDANQATVMPGFIDNHTHPTFGEYSPRSGNHDWIWHCLQGGVTTAISAGEVHVPGLPEDRAGIKAMAIAAQRSFANARPSGMKMLAGSPLLNEELTDEDFGELAAEGIKHLGEVGIGPVKSTSKAAELVAMARKHGMISISHTGGPSIPASKRMSAEDILEIAPDIVGHINGGYTALPRDQIQCLCETCLGALEIVHNGNEFAALLTLNYAKEMDQLDRIVIGTDAPAGCGVPALGILRTIALLSSFGDIAPELVVCFATGNTAKVRKLNCGLIEVGKEADISIFSAPLGGADKTVLGSLKIGDLPSVTSVLIDGRLVIRQSQNTPPPETPPSIVERRAIL
ncbi:amidohydrolase family protein [Halomonas sp. McH1-25]|uniref:amidohydrolase family protein n=1 Tax=unclassified Halomonas TaxID=2609666 RepID=UPI001EF6722A|nr:MULTISPECIES: amidohydrolase family protein [unclassified Halomonas]MCG7600073.1 amidohydrolase family protein [Halomonas sp. McH1-25]MCP1344242.1 amidohydrolase family protein [Halomonas sp. FL8]MCP1363157.1 amidohydrolase family protein [Halomonas sp. BBD45]MCP1364142.1 amidohydrolase family protein [Halomonas sp. BBD48]